MELAAEHRTTGSRRLRPALILTASIAALTMAVAASAQAAPNVAKAWGLNNYGQLGIGTTEGPEKCSGSSESENQESCSTVPVAVSGLGGVTAVAGGGGQGARGHSLALLENGTVMAWGFNEQGQLGNGTKASSDVPVAVSGLSEVTAIAASNMHSLALLKNGTVKEWGELSSGGDSDVPVEVAGLSGVTAIAAGGDSSLAVVSGGRVMAWGSRPLGNGTNAGSTVPVAVCAVGTVGPCPSGPYLEGATAVSASVVHGLALLSNGTVVAWGNNSEGELGDGTETASNVPVAVTGLSGVTAISAGGLGGNGFNPFSLALLSNGTVKAWGDNFEGELGDGTHTGPETCEGFPCSKTPVAVNGLSGVTAIAAHGRHSLALLANGAVMAWGSNEFGALGIGTSTGPEPCGFVTEGGCSTTPVAVKQADAVIKGIGAGDDNSFAFGSPGPPANLPEAGRCVKVAVGSGKYSGAGCTALATKTSSKKYEWTPASVTEKLAFSGSGLETTLTTAGHSTITCLAANISGEWTGAKTASVNVEFQGCTNAQGQQCQTVTNPQNKSEIALKGVLGELGYIKYEEVEGKPQIAVVGLDLKPQPPMTQLAEYECTGSTETGHLEGSVIGNIGPIDKMTTESNLHYVATKAGKQNLEAFQGSPKDTLMTSFTSGPEAKGSGASSLNIKEYKGNNAAPVEIKAK